MMAFYANLPYAQAPGMRAMPSSPTQWSFLWVTLGKRP